MSLNLYQEMRAYMRKHEAQRALCLRAEWPGHYATAPIRVWIESEVCDGLPSIKEQWQCREANGRWRRLLLDVMQGGVIALRTSNMPEGVLKSAYEAEGVAEAWLVTLGHGPDHGDSQAMHVQRYLVLHWSGRSPVLVGANRIGKALRAGLEG